MEFTITDEIRDSDRQEILDGLRGYNLERIEDKSPKDLGLYLEDSTGSKLAGLIGETHGNWLTVDYLWVSQELRGRRIGSSMLKKAEDIARERGCRYAFLNTFGFQAPEFYKKLGYVEVFTLREYPLTGARHFFTKAL